MEKRDFRRIKDISPDEADEIFSIAAKTKHELKQGKMEPLLEKQVLAMIFEKPSLRTRVTFETGMYQLGGHAIYLSPSDIGLGTRESLYDIAKNLERWVDLIMARTFSQKSVEDLARYASVPVINALSDLEHPCQAMSDFFTLIEKRGSLDHLTIAYIGDGNNICHSLILLSALLGVNISVAAPADYQPETGIIKDAEELAKKSGATLTILNDPKEAVTKADAIYTDVWTSMGQEDEIEARKKIFSPYQVNRELVSLASRDVLIMHDLPAHRGEEITDEMMDSPNSVVFDQAENRLHVQKAIMFFLQTH